MILIEFDAKPLFPNYSISDFGLFADILSSRFIAAEIATQPLINYIVLHNPLLSQT